MQELNWWAVSGLGLKLIFMALMIYVVYRAYNEVKRMKNEYGPLAKVLFFQGLVPTVLVALSLPNNFMMLYGSNELSWSNVSRILVNLAILSFGFSFYIQYNYNKIFKINHKD